MREKSDLFYDVLEWESLRWPVDFTHLHTLNNYYRIPKDAVLSISRGSDFKLSATLTGSTDHDDFLDYRVNGVDSRPGEIIYGEKIEGANKEGTTKYLVKHFFPQSRSVGFADKPPYSWRPFTARVHVPYVEQSFFDDKRQVETVLEFYLTSKIQFQFPRSSYRMKHDKVSKTRDGIDPVVKIANITVGNQRGWSDDHIFIATPDFDCIVQAVDKCFLPEWGNGIQIEYRTSFRTIPDQQIRTAISEIAGFALGTHLNKIGETHLDKDKNVIKRIAVSPWGDNVVDKCKASAAPPVSYDRPASKEKVEQVLNKLSKKYLDARAPFGLSDVLWKYWIAQELAVGTNLPIYSSSLESLAENFIKANNIITKYSQDVKDMHKKLVEDHLSEFIKELSATSYGARLINTIKNPFNVGVAEKLSLFFQTIGFQISNSSIENEAMKARNKMTHSAINDADVEERNKYTKLTEAYFVLINRCILSVLECDERYVDYYTVELPERDLKQNIGETPVPKLDSN